MFEVKYHYVPSVETFGDISSAVQLIVQNFPTVYVEKFLDFLADKIDNSPHTEFYMQWCTQLLEQHGTLLKKRSMPLMASIKNLQRSVGQKLIDLGRMYVCELCLVNKPLH